MTLLFPWLKLGKSLPKVIMKNVIKKKTISLIIMSTIRFFFLQSYYHNLKIILYIMLFVFTYLLY